jgi:hypothetical protein
VEQLEFGKLMNIQSQKAYAFPAMIFTQARRFFRAAL